MTAPALATLLLVLVPTAGGVSTEGWPITPEESTRMNVEHERLGALFPPRLDEIEAHRKAYPRAADPDVHLAEWGALFTNCRADVERFWSLAESHHPRAEELQTKIVSVAVARASAGEDFESSLPPEYKAIDANDDAITERNGKLMSRWWEEGAHFDDARRRRTLHLDHERHDAAVVRRFGLGALLILLLAGIAWRRTRLPNEPVPFPTGAGPSALLNAQAVPAVIGGNIDVVRPIGRGGMGEVYEGLDRTLQRRVALKRLRSELTNSPDDLSRLLAEARLVAALKHDNVVAIHAVEKEAGQVFLVFEYVDGPTLAAHIARFRQIAWPEALRIFSGAAAALEAAHAKNIVHRDLKPGNIMLDSKGVVKVMDFGIAHQAAQAVSRLTRSGAWGTPPYMSPEQELGEVNKGVDLFALNVCLYEMLTGELPFTGPNFLAQKRERVYVPVTKAVPALPKALDAYFATAFDPDPTKRFQDATTLAAAANAIA